MSPQADYIVANGTGASVRSDLNGQLAAIVSNNSGTTEPATMYAYQWWADTTAGLLKIRNAANNAWVTVGTLADANLGLLGSGSTIVAALGDASTPGITFTGDLNTGIFSPGADQVAVATNGTARLYIASDGKAGIGTTSPLGRLDSSWGGYTTGSAPALMIGADIGNTTSRTSSTRKFGLISGPHYDNGTDIGFIRFDSSTTVTELQLGGTAEKRGATDISFYTATTTTATPSESARIDSSGRLLVGKSTATVNGGKLELSGGITFPATAVAASNANTLDDYEEGTWTPVVSFGGASVGITGTFTGTYTKIGNSINVYFQILFTSKGSSTGTMKVAGLPFASALNYKANSGFAYVHRLAALQTSGQMYAADVGSELYFWFVGYGGAFASVFSNATVSNDSQINGSIIYF
jgi:hypothetical protein